MSKKELLLDILYATAQVIKRHGIDFLIAKFMSSASKPIVAEVTPSYVGARRLLSARMLAKVAEDGAFLAGPVEAGFMKVAIRKGLPAEGERRMAVENEPHALTGFSGEIKAGYGKGTKKLFYAGQVPTKVNGKYLGLRKIEIHEHQADRAGLHYDLAIEVPPKSKQVEFNLTQCPIQAFKHRYAMIRPASFKTLVVTEKDGTQYTAKYPDNTNKILITTMKDRGVVIAKPVTRLKHIDFLDKIDPIEYIVEWKPDGGLAIASIEDNRAVFTSHRPQAASYYDKLPAVEWLDNKSKFLTSRLLFKGPNLDKTVFMGELFHPEGASRVAGVLNSGADKAIKFQSQHGPVKFIVWDIVKYKGKDVSDLPYSQRRELYSHAVDDINCFNADWSVSQTKPSGETAVEFYNHITLDKRGLPYSEGVIVKPASSKVGETWYKLKHRDFDDVKIIDILEGTGKYAGTVGKLLVETPDGKHRGEVGSLHITDEMRDWIWKHRDECIGQPIEISHQEKTQGGSIRAGVFERFHSDSTIPLLMESEAIAGGDEQESRRVMYAMKSSKGWRAKS